MSQQSPRQNGEELVEGESYFEGYSDYSSVTKDINEAVARAMDGAAYITGGVGNGNNNSKKVLTTKRRLLAAAYRLLPEIEQSKSAKPELQEIHNRWEGKGEEAGYLEKVGDGDPTRFNPDRCRQFARDIRTAAFKLGYLQAGEHKNGDRAEVNEQQSEQMFDNL